MVRICVGHGFTTWEYFYDESADIFVISHTQSGPPVIDFYSSDEFLKAYPLLRYRLTAVKTADSENIIKMNETFNDEEINEEAVGDKYALMYGGEFISDFIYDDFDSRGNRYIPNNLTDVKLGGKFGIVNEHGNTVIPFLFDDVEFINDAAVFVKYNGRYGVLDVKNTLTESGTSPRTGNGFAIYICIPLCIFAVLTGKRVRKRNRI
jgi:hypothetical protein